MLTVSLLTTLVMLVSVDGAPQPYHPRQEPLDGGIPDTLIPSQIPENVTGKLAYVRRGNVTTLPTLVPGSKLDNDSVLATRVPGTQNDLRMRRGSRVALEEPAENTAILWSNYLIPYEIDTKFREFAHSQIRQGMLEWENHTCIRFIPHTTEENFVHIISGQRCWSNAGMAGGMQELSLRVPACLYFHYDILHELGHLIGRHHEQRRPDRDKYVKVMETNIEKMEKPWFSKLQWGDMQNHGVKYDYWSVMHYPQYAYTANGQVTIETKDPAYQWVIGNTPGLSFKDILVVNPMYQCSAHCVDLECPEKAIRSTTCKCLCYSGNPGRPIAEWNGTGECLGPDDHHVEASCLNYDPSCDRRASQGECRLNINYMAVNCRKACRLCGPDFECRDLGYLCIYSFLIGECESDAHQMSVLCMKTCKVCGDQEEYHTDVCEDISEVCQSIALDGGCELFTHSMLNRCPRSCQGCKQHPGFRCRNWHIQCNIWVEIGQCEENPVWMERHCPMACGLCDGDKSQDCRNYELDIDCERWARQGECVLNLSWMFLNCAKACRVCGPDAVCLDRSPSCNGYQEQGLCKNVEQAYIINSACPIACSNTHCLDETRPKDGDGCADYDPECEKWGPMGWCRTKPNLMVRYCPKTCHVCGPDMVCKDYNAQCMEWRSLGECKRNEDYMLVYCPLSCRQCHPSQMARCNHITPERCFNYLTNCNELASEGRCQSSPQKTLPDCPISCHICGARAVCQDFYPECNQWASRGECSRAPGFMEWFCRASCRCCG